MEIDLRGFDGFVPEPERDDGAPDAFVQEIHRRTVTQTKRRDMLDLE